MINTESFTADPQQIDRLILWWVSRSRKRYHRVMRRSSVRDFVQDVWTDLLSQFRNGKQVSWSLSTVVLNQCKWTLAGRTPRRPDRTYNAMPLKLQYARKVIFDDCVEFDLAIAKTLRLLPWRQAAVIRAIYGLLGESPMTLRKIGKILKISKERVRQIGNQGLCEIMRPSNNVYLLPFTDDVHLALGVVCSERQTTKLIN